MPELHTVRADGKALRRGRPAAGLLLLAFIGAIGLLPAPRASADSTVVFNEIMFHPTGNEFDLEWIELYNQMAVDMDISQWRITGGVDFLFPEGTVMAGGSHLLVAASPPAIEEAAGLGGVLGPWVGRLDNSGERIELRNNSNRLMDWVKYGDEKGWPVAPDGSGISLAKKDPDLASPPVESWTISAQLGGTPDAPNFPAPGSGEPGEFPSGLVSYWNFDQGTGLLTDLVGGNHGTAGTGAVRAGGVVGSGAISFDNTTNAFVSVGIGANFAVTDGLTVEAEVRTTWSGALNDEDAIYRKEDGTLRIELAFQNDASSANRDVPIDPPQQPVLSLGLNVAGIYHELDMPLDGQAGRPSLSDLKDGRAHHLAGTYDAASGLKAIFVDGRRVFEFHYPAGSAISSGGTTTAYIGNMSGRSKPFSGVIDEVAYWNRALSAGEIAQHYNQFAAGRNYFVDSPAAGFTSPLAFNEYFISASGPSWIEIVNRGDTPVALGGHVLALSGDPVREYTFPAQEIIGGGFAVVNDDQLGFPLVASDKLFLFAPGKLTAIDGVRIQADHQGRLPEGTGRWRSPSAPTPGAPNAFQLHDEIVINEILYHHRTVSSGANLVDSPEAWIELYNRSLVPVDLSGWKLDDGVTYLFEDPTILGPDEYLVVAADKVALAALYPGIRIVGNLVGRLSHKDDRIVLEDASGNPADEVHYFDGGRWPENADGGGSSLELRNPWADHSKPGAWGASDESGRSAWKSYSYRGVSSQAVGPSTWKELVVGLLDRGEALVDDFSVVEAPDTAPKELLQDGGFELGGSTWRRLGTHRASAVIPEPGAPASHVLRLVASGPTEHMHNHLETTFKTGLSVVDGRQYQISFRAKWLSGSNQLNTRLYFNRVARTTLLEVPQQSGTPGAQNSIYAPNIGPTFDGLSHQPVAPKVNEEVTVRAVAGDPDGVASVTLWWNAAGSGWQSAAMAAAGGGAYQGKIPGQSAATLVQFYVEAQDGAGAVSTLPPAGRASRALYRVSDGLGQQGKLHSIRILMLPADVSFLHLSTNVMSNDSLPATVVYDERTAYYDCGVRLKGSERGRPVSGRVGFHLNFPPDQLFRGVHSSVHIDRSGGWVFGGPSGQDEILAKHIANHAGDIPGMYDDIVQVIAPQSAQNGPALLMTAFTEVYLDGQYPDGSDGTKFKLELIYYPTSTVDGNPQSLKRPEPDDVIGADLTNLGNDKEAYRWTMLIENHEDRDDYRRFIDASKALSSPAAQLDAATQAVLDVDQWLRSFTMISLCGVNDTYSQGNNHNVMFFVRPSDQKVLAFPWDMDFAWVMPTSSALWGDQNVSRLIALTPNVRRYYGHLLDIIGTTFNSAYMTRWANHYAELTGENYSSLISFITQRRSFILSRIPAKIPFAITTNSGLDFKQLAATVTLEGSAWFDVAVILRGDQPDALPLTWTTFTRWRTTVNLVPGPNRLELQAFDRYGNHLGTDVITVTRGDPHLFIRGDANGDSRVDLADSLRVLFYLFAGQALACADAADADDNEGVDLNDAMRILNYLFLNGSPPPAPFPAEAADPAGTALLCNGG